MTKVGEITREFDTEITEQHPDERAAWKCTDGPSHAGAVTFHRFGEGQTKVTVQLDWQAHGIIDTADALVGIDDHQNTADLDRFKSYVEGQGGDGPGAAKSWFPRP